MEEKIIVKESVRGVVEYILKHGSLDDRYMGRNRAVEGTVAHQKLQASNEKIYENYEKEVKLDYSFQRNNITIAIEGRADGIIIDDGKIFIEEIKSTNRPLVLIDEDYNDLHWAQAKFYGYMYIMKNDLSDIYIKLSYYNLESHEVKSFDKKYNKNELQSFVTSIIDKYSNFIKVDYILKKQRDKSIHTLAFPFNKYRIGQRELAVTCYNTIKHKGVLFAQAPTGIGKTISTLFPSIKALGNGMGQRIVYLTAKTITRTVAEEAMSMLKKKGLKCRNITLTSKEKICFQDKVRCNPEYCKYAVDYFSKINNVVLYMIQNENDFNREIIEKYAKEYEVCPFELSLDLSIWCDIIIGDYNYAFDPRVRLKRFFEEDVDSNILLVDEGHNLVDRSRSMFSAEINKVKILTVSKIIKGKAPNLYSALNSVNKNLIDIRREIQEGANNSIYVKAEYKELYKLLRVAIKECDEFLIKAKGTTGYEEVLELYFDIKNFIAISELYSDEYVTIAGVDKSEVRIKLFCVNPSKNLSKIVQKSFATIIFSATLTPLNYYVDLLGGNEESYRIKLKSPFNKENFIVSRYSLNMRFSEREKNIDKLCKIIYEFINENVGNYMVFLPSYEYLHKIYERYIELYGIEQIICQTEVTKEQDRESFINNFKEDSHITAFCVIGGIFSEGIDLPGKRLIGSIIVGVGFPKISKESEIIKDYYGENGFDYSYVYPGINKVLQAAGRVIRTEEDKGRLLLVDDRYFTAKYKSLLPIEWIK